MLHVPICNCHSRYAQVCSPELLLSTCALRAGKFDLDKTFAVVAVMEMQDITAVLPSGKQQTVTLAVSAKVQELKEILQRCFDQQFLVLLDSRCGVASR